ncbi:MAG: hypothetical protein GC201_15530 [Alphaproteobacteria bacterium]|nr:hypothetical protein [Alphaproteobacteria bacterium]
MMHPIPGGAPLPVLSILQETARLHWRHILVLFAAAAVFATPIVLMLAPALAGLQTLSGTSDPETVAKAVGELSVAYAVALPLCAILFTFWVRVTLLGPRLALVDNPARWPVRVLWNVGLFLGICLASSLAMIPVTLVTATLGSGSWLFNMIQILMMVFVLCLFFALASRMLVERSMDIPAEAESPQSPTTLADHTRLASLFASVTFGLLLVEGLVNNLLRVIGAPLTAMVVAGLSFTLVITVFASIHAIVYRIRSMRSDRG